MRTGLTFNYKNINEEVFDDVKSVNKVYEPQEEEITIFNYYIEGYGCPVYLGGYFERNDTLFLCYQNMNSNSNSLKCVDLFKFSYKIENKYLKYNSVQMIEFQ